MRYLRWAFVAILAVFIVVVAWALLDKQGAAAYFLRHEMAPVMFGAMILFLLLGYPVAFALAANGMLFALIGIELGMFEPSFLQAVPNRVFGVMENDTLLAIPFFTFMGLILERSGMAEDLLDTVGQLFGRLPGGLAYAVIFVGALLAATTGVVAASVISMGLISLPIMMRYGYNRQLATGVIAASGTLAQIIPPSLVLIVLADQLGRSVGDMYQGAIIPGLVLTGIYALYVLGRTIMQPGSAPALPPSAITVRDSNGRVGYLSLLVVVIAITAAAIALARQMETIWAVAAACAIAYVLVQIHRVAHMRIISKLTQQVVLVMMPPLALIFLVLGTIFLGIATPTEGGAMGAAGALIMALAYRRLNWSLLRQAMDSTAKLSAFVVFILLGARVFSLTFYGVDGHKWVEHLLLGLPGGQLGFLIVVNVLVFLLAFFLDFFELAFIIIPLIGPVAEKLGIDLIWFGVLLGVNMQTSFMHPPFGFALFYLRSVAPTKAYLDKHTGERIEPITTGQIYWGAVPFVLIQVVMVAIVLAFPVLVTAGLDSGPKLDPNKIHIDAPTIDAPPPPPGSG